MVTLLQQAVKYVMRRSRDAPASLTKPPLPNHMNDRVLCPVVTTQYLIEVLPTPPTLFSPGSVNLPLEPPTCLVLYFQ